MCLLARNFALLLIRAARTLSISIREPLNRRINAQYGDPFEELFFTVIEVWKSKPTSTLPIPKATTVTSCLQGQLSSFEAEMLPGSPLRRPSNGSTFQRRFERSTPYRLPLVVSSWSRSSSQPSYTSERLLAEDAMDGALERWVLDICVGYRISLVLHVQTWLLC